MIDYMNYVQDLATAASNVMPNAYAPYSDLHIGAAVLVESGDIVLGVNVENASYGLTNCAERSALFSSIAQGHSKVLAVAIASDGPRPVMPCGACRQVMMELCGPDTPVLIISEGEVVMTATVAELLPSPFHTFESKQVDTPECTH